MENRTSRVAVAGTGRKNGRREEAMKETPRRADADASAEPPARPRGLGAAKLPRGVRGPVRGGPVGCRSPARTSTGWPGPPASWGATRTSCGSSSAPITRTSRPATTVAAARSAFWLGFRLFGAGELGRATGWMARAERLLDEGGHDCAERGYLLPARRPAAPRSAGLRGGAPDRGRSRPHRRAVLRTGISWPSRATSRGRCSCAPSGSRKGSRCSTRRWSPFPRASSRRS